jgi:hypothetical protein
MVLTHHEMPIKPEQGSGVHISPLSLGQLVAQNIVSNADSLREVLLAEI